MTSMKTPIVPLQKLRVMSDHQISLVKLAVDCCPKIFPDLEVQWWGGKDACWELGKDLLRAISTVRVACCEAPIKEASHHRTHPLHRLVPDGVFGDVK